MKKSNANILVYTLWLLEKYYQGIKEVIDMSTDMISCISGFHSCILVKIFDTELDMKCPRILSKHTTAISSHFLISQFCCFSSIRAHIIINNALFAFRFMH